MSVGKLRYNPARDDYEIKLNADGSGLPYLTGAEAAALYQPKDSDLTAISALATTSFGRALLTLANAAAVRTALELGTMSVEAAADYAKIAGQIGGSSASPDIRGIRETAGPTLLTLGSIPDGYLLKRSGSSVIGVTGATGGPASQPLGHDVSALPNVVSHWRFLTAVLGGTSVPDVLSAHDGTAGSTMLPCGRPWYNSEGQVLTNQSITLANTSALLSETRDASCYFMAWIAIEKPAAAAAVLMEFTAAGESLATNAQFQAAILSDGSLRAFWEHSSGATNVDTSGTKVAPGLRHICIAREHNTGTGTSTAHFWIDGDLVRSVSGLTNPSGGTSATGGLMTAGTDGVFLTDCVFGSGGIPSTAQVLTQYLRGKGVY